MSMERVRLSILHRPRYVRPSPTNAESAALEAQAEEARVARHAARLSRHEAKSQPTAAEAAARKRELFAEAQAQLAAHAAKRERETLERRGGGATLSLGDTVGVVTAEQVHARVEAERATLAANLRMAAQRAEAQRAARDAQRAAERENGAEWLDRRRRARV